MRYIHIFLSDLETQKHCFGICTLTKTIGIWMCRIASVILLIITVYWHLMPTAISMEWKITTFSNLKTYPDPVVMMTSSNGNIFALLALCAGNSPVHGEFPAQRPVTRSFDVFLDLRLNKRLSKQSWGWWFETLSWPLWRHSNGACHTLIHSWYRLARMSWRKIGTGPSTTTMLIRLSQFYHDDNIAQYTCRAAIHWLVVILGIVISHKYRSMACSETPYIWR